MDQAERDTLAYNLAKKFVLDLGREFPGITQDVVERYLSLPEVERRPQSMPEIYRRILESAQNANMRAGVIGKAIGGVERLGVVLCDFNAAAVLKKLGFANFGKPDIHLREIFGKLQLCPLKAGDYKVFSAIVRVAKNAGVTPYNADKLFWLVGSGNFYEDKQIGRKGKIGSHKRQFIAFARRELRRNAALHDPARGGPPGAQSPENVMLNALSRR